VQLGFRIAGHNSRRVRGYLYEKRKEKGGSLKGLPLWWYLNQRCLLVSYAKLKMVPAIKDKVILVGFTKGVQIA
jgi:hypothetical protein